MWKRRKHLICLTILILEFWLIAIVDGRADICSSLCLCVNESHFVKIHCDFIDSKEYTLDDGLRLPPLGTALNVTLGEKSRLTVKNGFFGTKNRINSVIIQGLRDDFKMTSSHVSFRTRAIDGIGGHFPEVCFRNIKSVTLSEKSLDGLLEIYLIVEGVWQLETSKEMFGMTTFNASFSEIADLQLSEGLLSTSNYNLTKPKMYINKSWIRNFRPLKGKKLTELRIENSEIGTIKPQAFRVTELHSLILDSVKIKSIEEDIFREGSAIENLAVTNCDIGGIATKAIQGVGITKFTFEKNLIDSIGENSMDFTSGSISIAHNKISFMGSNWLKTDQWSKVSVYNNTFGSFDVMALENPTVSEGVDCNIELNSFTKAQPGSFKSINEKCQIKDLLFKESCSCNFGTWLAKLFGENKKSKHQPQSYCSLDTKDPLLHCFKAETIKFDQYYSELCNRKQKLKCDKLKVDKIDAKFIDPKVLSDEIDWNEYMHYIIGGVIAAILIPCMCITFLVKRKSRGSTSDTYSHPTMHRQTDLFQLNQSEGPPSYEASLRSTKTFSNHDHIIIKRTLETMKLKQPEDKYEIVHNNTKRLLHEHLNEYEKVRIIGDIVQTIGECENSGEDFVAFTDILYKHLAPDTTTTVRNTTVPRPPAPVIDDVYAEPALPRNNRDPAKTNSEHIYAEPTVLMQQQTMIPLLLANNYSHPLDNNMNINNNNLYSEPVIHEPNVVGSSTFKPKVATPYAISDTIDQQPSTSKNLPDILNRMEPGPSGELNRINRSPITNRKIPEYTVPSTSHKTPVRVTQDTIEDWSDESMDNSQSSNHSGGSNATVKIEELIEYADNET